MAWMAAALACGAFGCGRQLVGVAKPAALLDWTPQANYASAQITAVKAAGGRTYVGFSDGEMFFREDGAAGWVRYGMGPYGGCGQSVPGGPVTSFAVTESTTFVVYAGTPGSAAIWRSPDDHPCWGQVTIHDDFLSLSVSPFSSIELLALGEGLRWVSEDLGGDWSNDAPKSLNFTGDARVMATGVGPTGAPRAWLGDGSGQLYTSDDLATATTPDQISWQPLAAAPGFPARPVVAISIAADQPRTVWVTFLGLSDDSLWRSDDAGLSWRNPHGGQLPTGGPPRASDGGASPVASFAGVSPVPGAGVSVVTALSPDTTDTLTATSFWNADGSDEWWPM